MRSIDEQFEHDFEVEAAVEGVWAFLWDIEAMARCMPGCEEVVTGEEKKAYTAHMRRKIGPFVIRMVMEIAVIDCEAPRRLVVEVSGRDKKLRSELSQRVTVTLGEASEGRSRVDIHTRFKLSGVLATLGWSLLSGHIQQELDAFVGKVQAGIEQRRVDPSA